MYNLDAQELDGYERQRLESYLGAGTFVNVMQLFRTLLRLARICANGVTMRSSPCLKFSGWINSSSQRQLVLCKLSQDGKSISTLFSTIMFSTSIPLPRCLAIQACMLMKLYSSHKSDENLSISNLLGSQLFPKTSPVLQQDRRGQCSRQRVFPDKPQPGSLYPILRSLGGPTRILG